MLLCCSKSSLASSDVVPLPTGEELKSDTATFAIPINVIRNANNKLLERDYLIKINSYNDSIIKAYKNIIINDSIHIKELRRDLRKSIDVNKRLSKSIKVNNIYNKLSAAVIVILTITLIVR